VAEFPVQSAITTDKALYLKPELIMNDPWNYNSTLFITFYYNLKDSKIWNNSGGRMSSVMSIPNMVPSLKSVTCHFNAGSEVEYTDSYEIAQRGASTGFGRHAKESERTTRAAARPLHLLQTQNFNTNSLLN
jgi:hypothetical protein